MKTALSLQSEESIEVAELAGAMRAATIVSGFESSSSSIEGWYDGRGYHWMGSGDQEEPVLEMALREAVRAVLPGSYCIPVPSHSAYTCGPLRLVIKNRFGVHPNASDDDPYRKWSEIPRSLYGKTETDCWARGLIAFFRAGLLPGGGA